MKLIQKVIIFIFLLSFTILFIAFGIDLYIEFHYNKIISTPDYRMLPKTTVAIVPGASVYGNTPSAILEDRLKSALLLYKYKKVQKILLSGDSGNDSYNELKPMLNFMLKYEVSREDIFIDNLGLRTIDTLYRAKYIFGIEDAIIVTQKFHQPRSTYIASHLGIQIYSYEADLHEYKDDLKNRIREFFARNLAFLDIYIFYRNYNYTGEKYFINGNGENTWKLKL